MVEIIDPAGRGAASIFNPCQEAPIGMKLSGSGRGDFQSDITDLTFETFIADHFSANEYLEANHDVAAAGVDPLQHWLEHGVIEGRSPSPTLDVRRHLSAEELHKGKWKHFVWRGKDLYLRSKGMPGTTLNQVLRQGRHDPAILAAGALALENLREFDATDLADRDGINGDGIFASLPLRPDAVLIIPFLVVGGAEKFAANLTAALLASGMRTVAVLVTDQRFKDAPDLSSLSILKGFQEAQLIFWIDVCGAAYGSDTVLARALNAIRPRHTIVINSRVGLETIARYGRGLSQFSKLYCAYFGLGVQALGAPYGAYYPRRTLPFAAALTDNEATAAILRDLYGDLPGPGIIVLPPASPPIDDSTFQKRLMSQRKRVLSRKLPYRWLWISRIEPFKGTRILAKVARARPFDRFELFGPAEGSLESLGLDQPNIIHHGVLKDVSLADLSSYDGFLFTSLFEGMPNVVLEIAQHAVPMVLAKVGGIPYSFDERAVFLVETVDEDAAVKAICAALDRLLTLSADECEALAVEARHQALDRHSPDAFKRNVSKLIGDQ
jgi:glycosyltransferase involved in cell wall biosynthesis